MKIFCLKSPKEQVVKKLQEGTILRYVAFQYDIDRQEGVHVFELLGGPAAGVELPYVRFDKS